MRRAAPIVVLFLAGIAGFARAQERPAAPAGSAKVTIEADGEPLLAILKKLCSQHGLNYVASEGALDKAGKVSLRLTDVPLDVALDTICEVYGLEARVRGTIVLVRLREASPAPSRPPERAPERPAGNRFLPEEPSRSSPTPEKQPPERAPVEQPVEKAPTPPAETPARRAAHVEAPGEAKAPRLVRADGAGGAIVVGTIVEISSESITVKEASGAPRTFFVSGTADDASRSSRLLLALRRLKRGDRIALECRTEEGRPVLTNLVGGGNPLPGQR